MELLIPRSWTDFSSLPKLHAIKTKFLINSEATYIGEIKNLVPPTKRTTKVSVPYNQPLSYIEILERTFSEILLMRKNFLLTTTAKATTTKNSSLHRASLMSSITSSEKHYETIICLLTPRADIFLSTFLQPVNGSKKSILN